MTEAEFVARIRADPDDATLRLVYADWLEEQADARGDFLRVHLSLRGLDPDQPRRVELEHALSRLRKDVDPAWLTVMEPE